MNSKTREPKGMVKQSMRQTKLYYYLSRLPEEIHADFWKYLNSPYFNKDTVVIRYYELLKEVLLDADKDLDRREFWELLYPEKAYKANRFRKVGTALQNLLKGFLAQQSFDRSPGEQALFFIRGLNHHYLDHYFPQNLKRTEEEIAGIGSQVFDPFAMEFFLSEQKALYEFRQPSKPTEKHYHDVINSLDKHLLFQKLKYACLSMNYDMAIGTEHRYRLLDSIVELVKNNLEELPPLIKAYYYVYRGLAEPENPEHYFDLKKLMTLHARNFIKSQSMELYTFGLNYIVRKLNSGMREFIPEIVELYEELLADEVILEGGLISRQNYKNITTMMCRIGQFDWTAKFLEDYKSRVLSDPEGAAYLYNKAVLEFHTGNFRSCNRLLNRFVQDDSMGKDEFYEIDVRRYFCMSLYEEKDFDLLEFQINSFQNYLPRNKRISEESKRNYIRFTRMLGGLFKAEVSASDKRDSRLSKLERKLESAPGNELFNWLRKKVEQAKAAPE